MKRAHLESTTPYIRQVVREIAENQIGIPAFQRAFIWKKDQIRDLFDSIQHGYPIGSVLLWKMGATMRRRHILTDEIIEGVEGVKYVLDGRQRLTVFYGCISSDSKKDPRFNLGYNLRTDLFQYPEEVKSNKDKDLLVPISQIFDTFALLDKLQQIAEKYHNDPYLNVYQKRAKELNSILQEYQIVQITLSDCSMGEAYKVFSRVNSKGTDINRSEMLQASSYEEGGELLVDIIEEIRKELKWRYNFEELDSEDVLNCFFKFADKNFYDLPSNLESINLLPYKLEAKKAILNAARFLYEECNVIDSKLLPYKKQFIALTWYFKEVKDYKMANRQELRKWFYYTTIKESFQNSSLSVVRKLFSDFDSFAKGKRLTAIDYKPVVVPSDFNFTLRWNSARADFLLLSLISYYQKFEKPNLSFFSPQIYHVGKGKIENYFILLNHDDKGNINKMLTYLNTVEPIFMDLSCNMYGWNKYGLNNELIRNYFYNKTAFKEKRLEFFRYCQNSLWKSCEYKPDSPYYISSLDGEQNQFYFKFDI